MAYNSWRHILNPHACMAGHEQIAVEAIPKCLCREGGTPSRTLPHMAIADGKPFHSPCPGYRSEERNLRGACSDKGVQNIHGSFWDEFVIRHVPMSTLKKRIKHRKGLPEMVPCPVFIQLRYTGMSVVKSADSIGVSGQTDYNWQDHWTRSRLSARPC